MPISEMVPLLVPELPSILAVVDQVPDLMPPQPTLPLAIPQPSSYFWHHDHAPAQLHVPCAA